MEIKPEMSPDFNALMEEDTEVFFRTTTGVTDPRLMDAAASALKTQQLTPLIKEELRYTILHRRYAKGEGELKIEEERKPEKRELTEEEMTRKLRRREQNRTAARRCRRKKKVQEGEILQQYENEKMKNNTLVLELQALQKERDELSHIMEQHILAQECLRTPERPDRHYYTEMNDTDFMVINPRRDSEADLCGRDSVSPGQWSMYPVDHFIQSPDLMVGRHSVTDFLDTEDPPYFQFP